MPKTTTVEADLLDRASRDQRRGSLGWLGIFVSLFLAVGGVVTRASQGTVALVAGSLFAASVVLINWTRFWIKESRLPFQYTFSVGEFEARDIPEGEQKDETTVMLSWLAHDLIASLGSRVKRLSLLESPSGDESLDRRASHLHISGWYGIRKTASGERADPSQRWQLEIVPQVRLGGSGAAAKQGPIVHLDLSSDGEEGPGDCPELSRDQYRSALERVYWSVASQVYEQIGRAVAEKIALLPPGRLRASAYLYEADDYATSNTLDAYAAARKLYRAAREHHDISSRPPPTTRWRSGVHRVRVRLADRGRRIRLGLTEYVDSAGRREVMTARAELGQARMMTAEWHLKLLCGTIPDEIYAVIPLARQAIRRLEELPKDVPERESTLLRGMLTHAIAQTLLTDEEGADKCLKAARREYPIEVRNDAEYLFVSGMNEPARMRAQRLLRQATEVDPTMERALFHCAVRSDDVWRSQRDFEPAVARMVDSQYRAVVAVDPGNIQAWANRGYIAWLLAEGEDEQSWRNEAFLHLEAGRQYKEVRREAVVAELDWNLARLAAEEGEFAKAYGYYTEAVSAQLSDAPMLLDDHFYANAGNALVERFKRYRDKVLHKVGEADEDDDRIAKSVLAFVLNDCGLALQHYYARSGDADALSDAMNSFELAHSHDETFILPDFNRAHLHHRLSSEVSVDEPGAEKLHLRKATSLLTDVLRREPDWAPAQLQMVYAQGELARVLADECNELEEGSDPSETVRTHVAVLKRERRECHLKLTEQLDRMLPHAYLDGKIDASGTCVGELVASDIDWLGDFSEYHVAALISWAYVLAADRLSAEAARELCELLREQFYWANEDLLFAHRAAAVTLRDREAGRIPPELLNDIIGDCEELLVDGVGRILTDDPAHYSTLTSETFAWFESDRQRELLLKARDAQPSPLTLLTVGRLLASIGENDEACRVLEKATEAPGDPVAPTAFLELADLRAQAGKRAGAIDAYWSAALYGNPQWSQLAAFRAGRLLLEEGKEDRALELFVTTASGDPEVGTALGGILENDPQLHALAIPVYEAVLDAYPDDPRAARAALQLGALLPSSAPEKEEVLELALRTESEPTRAEADIALASALMTPGRERTQEAESHLRQALESTSPEPRSDAAMLLADLLHKRGENREAAALYELAIDVGSEWTALNAALELSEMLEGEEDFLAAGHVYRVAARAHSWTAVALAHLLRDRGDSGDRSLAEELCEIGAGPDNRDPVFAPDAHLLLGELLQARGKRKKAQRAFLEAIGSRDAVVALDATFALAGLYASRGEPRMNAYLDAITQIGDLDPVWSSELEVVSFVEGLTLRLAELGDIEGMIEVALAAAPRGPVIAARIGEVLMDRGEAGTADLAYKIAARFDSGFGLEEILRQADAYVEQDPERAANLLRLVIAEDRSEASVAAAESALAEIPLSQPSAEDD